MKKILSLIFILSFSLGLNAQEIALNFDLSDKTPAYRISDGVSVKLFVQAPSLKNLLKHYHADPFNIPVITAEKGFNEEVSSVMGQYLSAIGVSQKETSDNQIHLKVSLCSINFLSDKGWSATLKMDLRVNNRNAEIYRQTLSAYTEEGGKADELAYAGTAINQAFYNALESVNWEQLDGSFTRDTPSHASNRDEALAHQGSNSEEASIRAGSYYALIIAIDDYQYLNKLDQPVKDASRLMDILSTSYNFSPDKTYFLKNPTREEIIDKLDYLVGIVGEEDNLLIFYAGHGHWDEERETGYWLPVDAKMSSTANWLRNTTIQEYIGDIRSKHTLLVADACFGGGIFKTRKAFHDAPSSINQMYELSSRKAITSGMLNEVPDRSVFFEYLSKRLEENEEQYTSSLQLFSGIRIAIMNNSDNVPQYGTIQKAGDEGGDFIFVRTGD